MIANIWSKILENGELSTNFVIVGIVIFGIATDFFATRGDLNEIRNRLKSIEQKITKVKTTNVISEKDVEQVKGKLSTNKEKIVTVQKRTNKLFNEYGQIKQSIKFINQKQSKIEEEVDNYHD